MFRPQSRLSLLSCFSLSSPWIFSCGWTQMFWQLQKQMTYLETKQNEVQAAKDEARRLKSKMKTFERYL